MLPPRVRWPGRRALGSFAVRLKWNWEEQFHTDASIHHPLWAVVVYGIGLPKKKTGLGGDRARQIC